MDFPYMNHNHNTAFSLSQTKGSTQYPKTYSQFVIDLKINN